MTRRKSGGTRANTSGKRLERFASEILEERGYRYTEPHRFLPMREKNQPIYSRQFETGKSIYDKRRLVDLILYHPKQYPSCLAIQCKWQASGGSVEEKYPYEVLCIQQSQYNTMILLDGGGYSDGARQWLLEQSGKNRLEQVFNQGEFANFANRGGFG